MNDRLRDFKGLSGPIAFDEKGDVRAGAISILTFEGMLRVAIQVVRQRRRFQQHWCALQSFPLAGNDPEHWCRVS